MPDTQNAEFVGRKKRMEGREGRRVGGWTNLVSESVLRILSLQVTKPEVINKEVSERSQIM